MDEQSRIRCYSYKFPDCNAWLLWESETSRAICILKLHENRKNIWRSEKTKTFKMFIACNATSWHIQESEGEAWLIDGSVASFCCAICAERFLCYWVELRHVYVEMIPRHQHAESRINRSHNSCSDFAFSIFFTKTFFIFLLFFLQSKQSKTKTERETAPSTCVKVWYSVEKHMFGGDSIKHLFTSSPSLRSYDVFV